MGWLEIAGKRTREKFYEEGSFMKICRVRVNIRIEVQHALMYELRMKQKKR